jgi:hypothetical protein
VDLGRSEELFKISDSSVMANRIGFFATMGQMTFLKAECQNKKRMTGRQIFLKRMDKLILCKRQ